MAHSLRLSDGTTAASRANKLTPHQRDTLVRFARRAPERFFVRDSDFGCKSTLFTLHYKGLLDKFEERGPRGGFITSYSVNPDGKAVVDHIRTSGMKTWR